MALAAVGEERESGVPLRSTAKDCLLWHRESEAIFYQPAWIALKIGVIAELWKKYTAQAEQTGSRPEPTASGILR